MDMGISKKYCQIAKINIVHNFFPHLLFSLLILLIAPVIFGISNLDSIAAWTPLEIFISLIGIILLTPIFIPEQDISISDVVETKYTNMGLVYLTRTIYSVLSLCTLIALFCICMSLFNSEVSLLHMIGTIASAIFLGSLGSLTLSLSHNIAVSYMIPIIYYAFNFFGGKNLGNFYLFSGMAGSYYEKIWLLVSGILLIALSLIINRTMKKMK